MRWRWWHSVCYSIAYSEHSESDSWCLSCRVASTFCSFSVRFWESFFIVCFIGFSEYWSRYNALNSIRTSLKLFPKMTKLNEKDCHRIQRAGPLLSCTCSLRLRCSNDTLNSKNFTYLWKRILYYVHTRIKVKGTSDEICAKPRAQWINALWVIRLSPALEHLFVRTLSDEQKIKWKLKVDKWIGWPGLEAFICWYLWAIPQRKRKPFDQCWWMSCMLFFFFKSKHGFLLFFHTDCVWFCRVEKMHAEISHFSIVKVWTVSFNT